MGTESIETSVEMNNLSDHFDFHWLSFLIIGFVIVVNLKAVSVQFGNRHTVELIFRSLKKIKCCVSVI